MGDGDGRWGAAYRRPRRWCLALSVVLLAAAACGDGTDPTAAVDAGDVWSPPASPEIWIDVDESTLRAEVNERFLSFAVDISQVAGGVFWSPELVTSTGLGTEVQSPYDFSRPRLRALTAELAPAILRVGGSQADEAHYALGEAPPEEPPEGFELTLTRAHWDGLADFAVALGLEIAFTLNGGPGARDPETKAWRPDGVEPLVAHAVSRGDPVVLWELGNELNGFPLFHGFDWAIDGAQYAEDLVEVRDMLERTGSGALLGGPSCAYWPEVGEMNPFMPEFMPAGGALLDVITWHYYPTQSARCPIQTVLAELEVTLAPSALDEVDLWASEVQLAALTHAPASAVWLGETGHAQCGGQPGASDVFAASFWWLDQLGRMARYGQQVVVRQTLSGSNYGLLDDLTLDPRPDYWASVLFKRLMGARVLNTGASVESETLRSYAHCHPGDGVTVLLIHLDQVDTLTVGVAGWEAGQVDVWQLTADGPDAVEVRLGGEVLTASAEGELPPLSPAQAWGGEVALPPLSLTFISGPALDGGVCDDGS